MVVLFFIYTILLELIYFLLSPILFAIWRKAPKSDRLALNYPTKHYDILVHAASVGEINGIRQLLINLLNDKPDLTILLTTNTKTGRKTATGLHPRLDVMISPLDVLHLRIKQMQQSKFRLILIAETEIWPQLLFCSKLFKIPVVYINARISQKTTDTYLKFNPLLAWLGKNIKQICAQSETDCQRFRQLFRSECTYAGNLKFSIAQPVFDANTLRAEWGYKPDDMIIVLGSSRPGEETLILNSFDYLKPKFPELKLIIAIRHMDRMADVNNLLAGRDVSYFTKAEPAKDIHIIDELGHLLPAYAICDIAIVGGSFYPFGGHNPLEAAFYSKVIIMGNHHESCLGSVKKLLKANAMIISDTDKLTSDLELVLSNPQKYIVYGERAKQVLLTNSESLPLHLKIIEGLL